MSDRQDLLAQRRRLARLPRWMQRFFTWLSGIALPGEIRPRPWTPRDQLVAYFATLLLAGALGIGTTQALVDAALRPASASTNS